MFNNMLPHSEIARDVQRDGKGSIMGSLLDEYYTYLEVNHRKNRTITQYKRCAEYLLKYSGKKAEEITRQDVNRYVAHLNQKYRI